MRILGHTEAHTRLTGHLHSKQYQYFEKVTSSKKFAARLDDVNVLVPRVNDPAVLCWPS
jgi:hypothetical protein